MKKGLPLGMCLWLTIVTDNAIYCTNIDLIFDGTSIWNCSLNLTLWNQMFNLQGTCIWD